MTAPLSVGADVVVTIVGRVEYANQTLISIITRFGGTLTFPRCAVEVNLTVIPNGPLSDADVGRLWQMLREDNPPEITSTGVWGQGSAGQPVGESGEGGNVATTRALPADPERSAWLARRQGVPLLLPKGNIGGRR